MTLAQFPKNKLFKNHDTVLMKKLWIFFPEMTLAQFPKSDFFIFRWIFFPKMTLAQFPIFGFFFQDSRIGVKVLMEPKKILKFSLDFFSRNDASSVPGFWIFFPRFTDRG